MVGLIAAAVAAALGLVACSDAPATRASTTLAPFAIDQDFPDPGVLVDGGTVYAYGTNTPAANVTLATSKNMTNWRVSDSDALPELPTWAVKGKTWAPAPAKLGSGQYALYFTAADAASSFQCIGVAVASTPGGPFVSTARKPLVCPSDQGGAIDPSTFISDDGQRFLVWKNDGNCCGLDTWIWIQPLSADGLTLEGTPRRLIKQTLPWEGKLVEAPVIVEHAGRLLLFYSANDYSTDRYAIGVAGSSSVLGPYTKMAAPLLSTANTHQRFLGPGGADLVSFHGRDWLVFHSWDEAYSYRGVHAERVTWEAGWPRIDITG